MGDWTAREDPKLGAVEQIPLCPYRADETRDEGGPQKHSSVDQQDRPPRLCGRLWTRAMGEGAIAPRPLAAPTEELRHPRAACASVLLISPISDPPCGVPLLLWHLACGLPEFKSCPHITCPGLGCHRGHRACGMSQLCPKASWGHLHSPLRITSGRSHFCLECPCLFSLRKATPGLPSANSLPSLVLSLPRSRSQTSA